MAEVHVIVPEPSPVPTLPDDNTAELVSTVVDTVEGIDDNMSELADRLADVVTRLEKLETPPEPPQIPAAAPEPEPLPDTPLSPTVPAQDLTEATNADSNSSSVDTDLNDARSDNPPSTDSNALGEDATSDNDGGNKTGTTKRTKDKSPRIKMSTLKRALIGGSGGYKRS